MKSAGLDDIRVSLFMPTSRSSTSVNKTGSWSFMRPLYKEKTAPCSAACPCGQDIPRIEMLVSRGRLAEAWRTLLSENPLPGVCGRVCFHPCEDACNRGEFDEAVSINALERFIDEAATRGSFDEVAPAPRKNGRRVAVVGSGPAGLSAAYFLSRLGFDCEILEAGELAGGVLRTGIPAFRLPASVLDREIGRVVASGAELRCSTPIEPGFLTTARKRYDAVFVACGHGKSASLGIPGAELAVDGLAFLDSVKNGGRTGSMERSGGGKPPRALVIGGGNSAVDVARSLRRLGAEPVIVYRRRQVDMPAFREEIERALAEEVRIVDLAAPLALVVGRGGLELSVQKMRESEVGADGRMKVVSVQGATETIAADAVYTAIGAGPAESWMIPPKNGAAAYGHCAAHWASPAGLPLLFGGDTVNRAESVADAVASGKEAAIALDAFFKRGLAAVEAELERCRVGGGAVSMEIHLGGPRASRAKKEVAYRDLNLDYFSRSAKARGAALEPASSVGTFAEVEAALDASEAARQAARCFNCGICNDCDNCRTFCPEAAVNAARAGRNDWTAEAGPDRSVNEDYCKGCGICVTECPRAAMDIQEQQS